MIIITKPLPEDAMQMNEVIKSSWYEVYTLPEIGVTKEDIDSIYADSETGQIEAFRKRASSTKENDITLVAKDGTAVLGIIRVVVFQDHTRVRTLYVHPNNTSLGIGTMLWQEIVKYIPKDRPVLAYPVKHTRSVGWYEKMGFKRTNEETVEPDAMPVSGVHLTVVKMILSH